MGALFTEASVTVWNSGQSWEELKVRVFQFYLHFVINNCQIINLFCNDCYLYKIFICDSAMLSLDFARSRKPFHILIYVTKSVDLNTLYFPCSCYGYVPWAGALFFLSGTPTWETYFIVLFKFITNTDYNERNYVGTCTHTIQKI